ncbi:MAG: helix-turn-helix domain-containing protein [Kiritimatiellae bacterium]|nr:helix-turn-helix domain-containing protein [Kiritimatiellia bacterium]
MLNDAITVDPWEFAVCSIWHANIYPCKPEWRIHPHVMRWYSLFYIKQGYGWVEIDGHRVDAKPGDLFVFRLSQQCSISHDPQRPFTVLSMGFSLRGASNRDLLRAFGLPHRMRLTQPNRLKLEALYMNVITAFNESFEHRQLSARGALMMLVAEVLRMAEAIPASRRIEGPAPLPESVSWIIKIQAFIENNLEKVHSIDSLASRVHASPSHFAAVFRRETGLPPMGYVRARRITRAKSMLAASSESVAEIAEKVGFDDPYHFSRVFRRIEGVSPRTYRASLKHPSFP